MTKRSLPSHDGFGSALRKASTLLWFEDSVKTEPWSWLEICRHDVYKVGPCRSLERLGAINASHTNSRYFPVFGKIIAPAFAPEPPRRGLHFCGVSWQLRVVVVDT